MRGKKIIRNAIVIIMATTMLFNASFVSKAKEQTDMMDLLDVTMALSSCDMITVEATYDEATQNALKLICTTIAQKYASSYLYFPSSMVVNKIAIAPIGTSIPNDANEQYTRLFNKFGFTPEAFVVMMDYSAMNRLGGMNRSTIYGYYMPSIDGYMMSEVSYTESSGKLALFCASSFYMSKQPIFSIDNINEINHMIGLNPNY